MSLMGLPRHLLQNVLVPFRPGGVLALEVALETPEASTVVTQDQSWALS